MTRFAFQRRCAKFAGGAVLATLLLASPYSTTSMGASAATDTSSTGADDVSIAAETQTAEEALRADIESVAAAEGITVDEPATNFAVSEALAEVAIEASNRWPDQFVGSASSADGAGPTLYVKGGAPAELVKLADTKGVRVVDGQPHSFAELEEREIKVHQAVVDLGYQFATSSFDVEDGRWVDVNVAGRADGGFLSPDEIIASMPAGLRKDIRVTVDQGTEGYGELSSFGGMWLRAGGANTCTSGWAVERTYSTALTGISTAGHCAGIDHIVHPGDGSHTTDFVDSHRGAYGDIEWHTTPQSEPDNFYASASDVRDVASVAQIAGIGVDDYVCFYGRSSNDQFCGLQVEDVSISCTVGGVTNNRLVQMDVTGPATGGDSGGPFFYGTKAYGSVKGFCASKLSFSAAAHYDAAISVRVRR